jgi:F420 biosynthesis protein FbiB-like protein
MSENTKGSMTATDSAPVCDGAVQSNYHAGEAAESILSPQFWRLVRTRRSIRRYLAQPLAPATLLALLEAAHWAPSAHNRQPWRFCVVTSASAKEALSSRMSERWQRDLAADGVDPQVIGRRLESSHARLTNSPALIVPCVTMEDMDAYPDTARSEAEYIMAVQSVALACQNLLLAAHDAGLGASWLCAPLFVPQLVCEVLELPQHWRPQAILTLGYGAEQKERDRAPIGSQVVWR